MSAPPPSKIAVPLAPLRARLELDAAGEAALGAAEDAQGALEALLAAGRLPDALRLLAHALPKREAVWWACMCARGVPALAPRPEDLDALAAAEAWVRKPEEATRRACMAAGEKAGFRSPESWAAAGAFWSGGSIAPEGVDPVAPADHLTGAAVSGAIVMAALRHKPERMPQRLPLFLEAARDIASGGAGRLPPETP
jgi:hypothetical protein